MASSQHLRQKERPADAGRFAVLATRARLLASIAALIALATAVFAASQLARLGTKTTAPAPAFLRQAIGSPQTRLPLRRTPAPHTHAAVTHRGYVVHKRSSELGVALAGPDAAGAGAWDRYESGLLRRTSFGSEVVTLDPTHAEDSLTITKRQGPRTWRWSLALLNLEPRLRDDGSVALLRGGRPSGLSIAPVAIADERAQDVTPARP